MMFTRDTAFYPVYHTCNIFCQRFEFQHPTQIDVKNHSHSVNLKILLQIIYNYFFVNHYNNTNLSLHVNSLLQYLNTNYTSPYCLYNSYFIKPRHCKRTLRNVKDPIHSNFLSVPSNFLSVPSRSCHPSETFGVWREML